MNQRIKHGPFWTGLFSVISLAWLFPLALVLINSFKEKVYISADTFSLPLVRNLRDSSTTRMASRRPTSLPALGGALSLRSVQCFSSSFAPRCALGGLCE